ncbi:MAG TPA: GNAT family N-acetyltransferase [Hyphomicrobiales bacterium]
MPEAVRIVRLDEAGGAERWREEIEAIFFANAGTKDFASEGERDAYRELWLGRYLRHCSAASFVALTEDATVAGYLAGALVSNRDPLPGPDYYALFSPALVAAHPAHVHVNIREDVRGQRIGSKLIAAFRALCAEKQIAGLHAVTTAGSRAANFFMQSGMAQQAETSWRGRRIVFLGERL